jgi:hypothetical protein
MYSPKIKERFIPVLYRIAQEKEISMTRVVNNMVADYLSNYLAHKLSEREGNKKEAKEETKEALI